LAIRHMRQNIRHLLCRQYIPLVNNFGNFMQWTSPFRLPKLQMEATILCV
jgi:hypothetical protein